MAEVSPLAMFGGLGGFASFDTANNTPVNGADNINEVADGNHSSTLLIRSRCDAFGCGQLISLADIGQWSRQGCGILKTHMHLVQTMESFYEQSKKS